MSVFEVKNILIPVKIKKIPKIKITLLNCMSTEPIAMKIVRKTNAPMTPKYKTRCCRLGGTLKYLKITINIKGKLVKVEDKI